ncbi:MAG: hypothetical protein O3B13_10480 [Planctomycetota bacterium]|nr:hypothetical protein [Planctomycetota bacterium]MDA1163519.1 hypothetical protein [Planctomycetota bacterium]
MTVSNSTDLETDADNSESASATALTSECEVSDIPTRRQKRTAAAISVFGFVVFYLLSAGPMAGIHNVFKVRGFQKTVEVIYAPVVFLVKSNIEPFSSIMKWYVDLFR